MSKNKKIKTRMAPSPTGMAHIGSLRTALYNYLFAKQNGGEFVLRIEDTDRTRLVENASEKALEMFSWAGLKWDGQPVAQSSRLEIYQNYAKKLIDEGKAYQCFCSPEELREMREEQKKKKQPPRYDGRCRNLSKDEVVQKLLRHTPYVIRLKVPKNKTVEFKDEVYGKVKVNSKEIDDQVLIKSDRYPTYHLAVVVDDHEMGITHVMRGEDWLPSTPKHALLHQAFGWDLPTYAHLPNILGADKKKLSKRKDDVSVEDFKNAGYLPEALINYLALLGWNPGTAQEIFSMTDLVKQFDIKKVHKAGAIFDARKLDNINGQYVRKLKIDKLIELCLPYLEKKYDLKKFTDKYIEKVMLIEQERLKKLSDIAESAQLFFADKLEYEADLLVWKKTSKQKIKDNLTMIKQKLEEINKWTEKNLEKQIMAFIKDNNLTNGEVLWPLRVALSGQKNSPGPFEIMGVIGKDTAMKRIESAIIKLN